MGEPTRIIEEKLETWLSDAKKVAIAGIGNPIRMDDFVGVRIVQILSGKVSDKVLLIECESIPESYIQQIINFNPTHVLLIDAALLGLNPGEPEFLSPEQLPIFPAYSTHILPLRIFCEHLLKTTEAKIGLLLIQPKQTDFGEGLTPEVEASAEKLSSILLSKLPK
ncbi:MAG: hydrogenase maturation protease [Nitrososphaerota archaeon]|nr:hydrogenase maturation protease [Candidatus Bathyarchaeota archaeon]MDW8193885.1 hydrogenase maturation protease [Nitrososphaerota archaeon]